MNAIQSATDALIEALSKDASYQGDIPLVLRCTGTKYGTTASRADDLAACMREIDAKFGKLNNGELGRLWRNAHEDGEVERKMLLDAVISYRVALAADIAGLPELPRGLVTTVRNEMRAEPMESIDIRSERFVTWIDDLEARLAPTPCHFHGEGDPD